MKIRLEEYSRGARVRLMVDDAPMSAVSRLVEAFVTALDEVAEKQDAGSARVWVGVDLGQPGGDKTATVTVQDGRVIDIETVEADRACGHQHIPNAETEAAMAEVRAKRKRRTKAEMQADAAQKPSADPEQASDDEPGLPLGEQDTPAPTEVVGASETSTDTAPPVEAAPTTDAEITDSELQRYCAKLAQHFGTPQTVFDLAGKFVPDGAVARPTNIRDNSQRWAFVRAAQEASGLAYHG